MKLKPHSFSLLALILSVFCLLSGCTSPPGSDVYRLKQTGDDVGRVMTRYRNLVAFGGTVTTAQQQQVSAAYDAYQQAFNQAVQDAHSNYDAPTPDNVKALANQVISLVSALH